MLKLTDFQEYYACGLTAYPVIFNDEREPIDFPKHGVEIYTIEDVQKWLHLKVTNGIALKMTPPFGMFDFDIKNTDNKRVYEDWFNIVAAQRPEILKKVCIESTKSAGFHCYIKYEKLSHKIPVARSKDGKEVVSVYTGGLLSFSYPSPGYKIFHNDFNDLDFLTDAEFDFLVTSAALFNEYHLKPGESNVVVTDYPVEYENICLQFDSKCTAVVSFTAHAQEWHIIFIPVQPGIFYPV